MTFYLHPYPYRRTARRWFETNQRALGVNVHEEDEAYVLSALVIEYAQVKNQHHVQIKKRKKSQVEDRANTRSSLFS